MRRSLVERTASGSVYRPKISEEISYVVQIHPIASDWHQGIGFLRKPPGDGPFPVVVFVHGGLTTWSEEWLRDYSLGTHVSRFLAQGFVCAVITYRSRNVDPQSTDPATDVVAAVKFLGLLPYVDANSIAVRGSSGGGDLALTVAATIDVAAIIAEEPASMFFTGIMNASLPKTGDVYSPSDSIPLTANPWYYYTDDMQELTRQKIAKIACPILIIQGTPLNVNGSGGEYTIPDVNRFNAIILIPELYAFGKNLEVRTYPGEPHGFSFNDCPERTPRPKVAEQAFMDMLAFLRQYLPTKPYPLESSLIEQIPWAQ